MTSKLPFNTRRLICGVVGLVALMCLANFLLKLGIFGRYDLDALILSFVLLYLELVFLGPSLEEIQDYRARKNLK